MNPLNLLAMVIRLAVAKKREALGFVALLAGSVFVGILAAAWLAAVSRAHSATGSLAAMLEPSAAIAGEWALAAAIVGSAWFLWQHRAEAN